MDDLQVLLPLNNYLSVKSAARLRCVSTITRDVIKLKNYSFYNIFKQLDLSPEYVIKMLFESDKQFVFYHEHAVFYMPISRHKYGKGIKEYIKVRFYNCINSFNERLKRYPPTRHKNLHMDARDHAFDYTSYRPLRFLLTELCLNLKN